MATNNVIAIKNFSPSGSAGTTASNLGARQSVSPSTSASSVFIERPDWEETVNRRLRALFDLAPGWDGFNARALNTNTAIFGVRLLHHLLPIAAAAPQLSPTNYGGIQFEWYSEDVHFEIEVEAPYQVRSWYLNAKTGEEREQLFEDEFSDLKALVNRTLKVEPVGENATAAA